MIASIALAHGLVLVTHNVPELARVPGLRIEDWGSLEAAFQAGRRLVRLGRGVSVP